MTYVSSNQCFNQSFKPLKRVDKCSNLSELNFQAKEESFTPVVKERAISKCNSNISLFTLISCNSCSNMEDEDYISSDSFSENQV